MKRLLLILLVACIILGSSIQVFASPSIHGPGPSVFRGDFSVWSNRISRCGILIVLGDLYIDSDAFLHIDGWIFVNGEIIIRDGASISGRTWQLHPTWQWISHYLFFGWLWMWFWAQTPIRLW